VEVDAATLLAAAGSGHGDVDGAVEWLQEPPEDGGGAVAEDRALTAGENGRHETAVEVQAAVADGVDTLVDAVEAAPLRSLGHCVSA
jgi:hypothetical protein